MDSQTADQPMHQVSPQDLMVPNQETPAAVSIPSMPKSEPISSEGGPYGPWMLVKRPPRRKSDLSTKRPTQNNAVKQAGSRFALLEQEEHEENIETAPKKDLVPVIAKVRNPNAGENSQKDQKGKNSIMGQHNKKDQGRKQVVKKDKAGGLKILRPCLEKQVYLEAFKDFSDAKTQNIDNNQGASSSGAKYIPIDPKPPYKDNSTQDMVIDSHRGNGSVPHDNSDMQ
ncbi:hypothetical protein SESBI_38945, partial [Sesbania bispinosa]